MNILIKNASNQINITATVRVEGLSVAVNKCNLSYATLSNPLIADDYVNINTPDVPTFYSGDELIINVKATDNGTKEVNAKLVGCSMKNVSKSFNLTPKRTQELMKDTFETTPPTIMVLPDGSITIAPSVDETTCTITIKDTIEEDVYIAYTIVFSLLLEDYEHQLKRYYFIIDPVVRISSGQGIGNF